MTKTMTLWGASCKLEALARVAEARQLPGRIEIREAVERMLRNPAVAGDRDALAGAVLDFRCTAGLFAPRTGNWLDEELFKILDYMDADVVELAGAELLDQLMHEPDPVTAGASA